MIAGGCQCGAIRYEVKGEPFHLTNCHCSSCRDSTGAPFVAWFSVRAVDWRIIRGEPACFHSTTHGLRSFCAKCGTQLIFADADLPDEIDITTCSLDDPQAVAAHDHTFVRSKLEWLRMNDGLPEFLTTRR